MAQPVSPEHPVPAEQLVLAASLARAFPLLGCSLALPCGRRIVVADHPVHEPHLCTESFARLLRLEWHAAPAVPGLRWLRAVVDVHLAGPGLSDRGGGLIRLSVDGVEHLAFGALLDVGRARHVLEHAVADDGGMLDDVVVSVRIDPLLDCVVVSTALGPADPCGGPCGQGRGVLLEEAMRTALAACMVEELIGGSARARPG